MDKEEFRMEIEAIQEALRSPNQDGYRQLRDLLSRGIKLEAYQANLMFLGRGYGKTYMSYCLAAEECIDLLGTKELVTIGKIDSDILIMDVDFNTTPMTRRNWFEGFERFCKVHFSELEVKTKNEFMEVQLNERV